MRQGLAGSRWLVLTSLIAFLGCWNGSRPPVAAPPSPATASTTPAAASTAPTAAPVSPATVSTTPAGKATTPPKTLIAARELFFVDREPQPAAQPLPVSLAALQGRWIAYLPGISDGDEVWLSDIVRLTFEDKMPRDYFADITIPQTKGTARLMIDGNRYGLTGTTLAWGADAKPNHVWMAALWAKGPTMEVSLVREDLLRVTGTVLLPGGLDAQLDLLLINIPEPVAQTAKLPALEVKDAAGEKMVAADSIEPYLGEWVAQLPAGKFTLKFDEHRVLKGVIESAEGTQQTVFDLLRFNPAEKCMQLQNLAISASPLPIRADLRLTESGKLLWLWHDYNEARGFVFQRNERQVE